MKNRLKAAVQVTQDLSGQFSAHFKLLKQSLVPIILLIFIEKNQNPYTAIFRFSAIL
jgi:hypothetical protein